MAKKVTASSLGITNTEVYTPISKHDKEDKKEGRVFILDKPYQSNHQPALPVNTKFIECNDGWYRIEDDLGRERCYRVGSKFIKEVFGAEVRRAI